MQCSGLPVGCSCCLFPREGEDDDDDDPHGGGHSPHHPQHSPLLRAAGHQAAHQVHVFLPLADCDESGEECQHGLGEWKFQSLHSAGKHRDGFTQHQMAFLCAILTPYQDTVYCTAIFEEIHITDETACKINNKHQLTPQLSLKCPVIRSYC